MDIKFSGSLAKGTANKSSTDVDIFISLSPNTPNTLEEIFNTLYRRFVNLGFVTKKQNVSVNIKIDDISVDLVPGQLQVSNFLDHSLYHRRKDSWIQTNIDTHIKHILEFNRLAEIRLLKLWRNQWGLEFPSFCLELVVTLALMGIYKSLAENVWEVLKFLRDEFIDRQIEDPANTNNIVSDTLTIQEKMVIAKAAGESLKKNYWNEIIK